MTAKSRAGAGQVSGGCAGLLALLGAGCPGYFYEAPAYFANTTREPVNVRVQQLQASVACQTVSGRSAELLAHRELFADATTFLVGPGEALPLHLDEGFRGSQAREPCAVLVQLLGFPDQLVFWSGVSFVDTATKRAPTDNQRFRRQSLRLEGYGKLQALAPGEALEVTALPPANSAQAMTTEEPTLLGWSGLSFSGAEMTLFRREVLPDGCLSLELGRDLASASPFYLCAPIWAFPFEVGQALNVTTSEAVAVPSSLGRAVPTPRHLSIKLSVAAGPELELWLDAAKEQVMGVGQVTALGPPSHRSSCGAYADSLSVELPALRATLLPGEEAELTSGGLRTRALLGRADGMLVAPDDCGAEYSSLGNRFDLLILKTPASLP